MMSRNISVTTILLGSPLFSFAACTQPGAAPAAPPPPSVAVVHVVERDVPLISELIATLDGYVNAPIDQRPFVAASANLAVARANYFPQVSLTGSGGFQSAALSSLLTGPAAFFTVGASLLQPVFTAGHTRSQVELAEAQRDEALLAYQQTILQSLRDASDALIAYRKDRDFRNQQELLARSAGDALRLTTFRNQGGASSYLEVPDADTRLFKALLGLAQAHLNEQLALVQIYRALDGGWEQ